VERHGGKIAVASEAGRGTAFTITLPLQSKIVQVANPVSMPG
jgi:signal transduction histidine kinase